MRFSVGCRLDYELSAPGTLLFNVHAIDRQNQRVRAENFEITQGARFDEWTEPATENRFVRVNAPAITKKARNLEDNNKLSVLIIDPQNSGHWIEIQGRVGEMCDDAHGSLEHINELSEKYTGNPV